MNSTIAAFFTRYFYQQVFTSPKHWGVICLTVTFMVFSILFYGYIESFKQIYINSLRGLYPEAYIETLGEHEVSSIPGVTLEAEIFQISQILEFRFHPGAETIALFDVGVRAAAPQNMPSIARKVSPSTESYHASAYINNRLYQKLAGTPAFDGRGIYLKSRKGSYQHVTVNTFHAIGQDDKDWIILPARTARELGMLFNISTIYTNGDVRMEDIKKTYAADGLRVFQWMDRLPFLNLMLYQLGVHMYTVFMAATVFLVGFLMLSVFHDMLMEFKKVMRFSMIYGLNGFWIFLVFVAFSLVYAMGCHALAGKALFGLQKYGASVFPLIGTIPVTHLTLYLFLILMPFLFVMNGLALLKVRSEGYVPAEE